MKKENIERKLLELFCYMSSSARGCVEEPKLYGPFRIIDFIERIIQLLEDAGIANDFLEKEKEKIEEGKYLVMQNEEKFVKFLDKLVIDFAKELAKGRSYSLP